MTTFDRTRPVLPAIFAQLLVRIGVERGLDRGEIVKGLDLPGGLLGGVLSRVSLGQFEALMRRLIKMGGGTFQPGYELGLSMGLSTAGVVGAAAMTRASLRGGIEFILFFRRLFTADLANYRFFVEDEMAVIEISTKIPVPPDLRAHLYDWILVGLWRGLIPLTGDGWREVELWFDYDEPDYYKRYRERLPRCRFDMGANQICFPAKHLDRPLAAGDPITADMLEAQCRHELTLLGDRPDVVLKIKPFLTSKGGYPDLAVVAENLCMSGRTLRRKLHQQGTSYQQLLDDARREEACGLLKGSTLSLERIAAQLGYADAAGFSTAFTRWTGMAPGAWRRKVRA